MGQFGDTAVRAAKAMQNNPRLSAYQAWISVIRNATLSNETKKKCCPREAFIGLCNSGCIHRVRPINNTQPPGLNARYACHGTAILQARNIQILQRRTNSPTQASLWRQVLRRMNMQYKTHNSQMDVVIQLWINGLI